MTNRVLQAVVRSAVEGTEAEQGWLVARRRKGLVIAAAYGGQATDLIGTPIPPESEGIGVVLASGTPMSLTASPDDQDFAPGVREVLGRQPTSMLCVPCPGDEDNVGVLVLLDKLGGDAFPIEEVELASLIGTIGGAAIDEDAEERVITSPAELHATLIRVAAADPDHYALVASVVSALSARG